MKWRAEMAGRSGERRWRRAFAWLPVRTTCGWPEFGGPQWVWLESVEILEECVVYLDGVQAWMYRGARPIS